jgi:membrane magnesium transporter 1
VDTSSLIPNHTLSKVVFEALMALVLGIIGASLNAPPLKEITWASEMKTWYEGDHSTDFHQLILFIRSIDEMDSRLGFASYVHHGTSFLGSLREEDKKKR